jgi:glycosyltransferase involved in cell wall biosynthesis
MDVCFFGAYDPGYPRNAVLRRGLASNGVRVWECGLRPGPKFWLRYPLLMSRWMGRAKGDRTPPALLFVPEFCQKDVPLARFLSTMTARKVVFDPLASRFETKILDWRSMPEGSLAAWWNKIIDRRALALSHLILADTEEHKKYYSRQFGLDPQKIVVLPVGFDDEIYRKSLAHERPSFPEGSSPFTVFFFGSFLPLHGVETMVEAARWIWAEDKAIRFRFIGSGQTLDRVRRQASDFGLGNVCFEGWLRQPVLAERIAAEADVCLGIFGRTEKAERVVPHKVFQAMALHKPVITARTPAVEEFFSHRKTIMLCRKEEPESLARAVLELKRDSDLRIGIARNGHELVWKKFHPHALGSVFKDILISRFGAGTAGAS